MKIIYLQISNVLSFRFYDDIANAPKIIFDSDLNILIGENGSGKSTALEVLNFIFRRVIFKQSTFNEDQYSQISNLTPPQRKAILSDPNQNNISTFRIESNWRTQDKIQKVRLRLLLDEIDKANIININRNLDKLQSTASAFSSIPFPNIAIVDENFEFEINVEFRKSQNSFTNILSNQNAISAFNYLANYNFLKYVIRIHNLQNPQDQIDSLFESFSLISSFRNYSSYNASVSLRDQSAAQQIQSIYNSEFTASLNDRELNEPAIFNLVRLRVAEKHYNIFGSNRNRDECETEVNREPFLNSINSKLRLVGLECKIRLTDQRLWQYSFEFRDIVRDQALSDINSLSAGQKAIIHLVFEAYGRGDLKGGLVVIDEPEIHLHYQFQHEYLRVLETLNSEQKCQYILVTHSEALINSTTIHNVKRFTLDGNEGTRVLSPQLSFEQKMLVKILDNTRATYAFFGKKVVLVEGDSDRYFFKAAIQHLNPDLSQEISVLDIGGKGSLEKWKTFFDKFGLRVYFIGDFDNVFSLQFNGQTLVTPDEKEFVENQLKQERLDNLSLEKLKLLKSKFENLTSSPDFLDKPNRENWKALLDTFIALTKVDSREIAPKINARDTQMVEKIESKYNDNIFILKNGDLEKYLGLESKGLANVIQFCNESLFSYFSPTPTREAQEINNILNKIIKG